jgi:Tfp pilus assembly protein FimT
VSARTFRRLVEDESGVTLLDLLITLVISSILLLIAVPAYLQYADNAYRTTAMSNVKNLAFAAGLYEIENYPGSVRDPDFTVSNVDTGYQGMTVAELRTFDSGLASGTYVNNSGTEAGGVTARAALDATHFCVYATAGRWFAYQLDPSGQIATTIDPAAVCT